MVLAEALGRVRPRDPRRVAVLEHDARVPERRAATSCSTRCGSPGRTIREASAATSSRWRSRPGTCCTATSATRRSSQHAATSPTTTWRTVSRRPGRSGRTCRSCTTPTCTAAPFDGDMRAGQGLSAAGQGRLLRRRAGDAPQGSPASTRVPRRRRAGLPTRSRAQVVTGDAEHSPVALPRARGRTDETSGREGLDRLHHELDRRAAAVRGLSAFRARRHGGARPRARARDRVAGRVPDEDEQLGAVLRGHPGLLEHRDQRRDHGALRARASRGVGTDWRATPAAFSTGSSARSATRSSCGTASRPSTSSPLTGCPATATRHATRRSS